MSNWNHRIVDLSEENGGEPWLALREVYYHEDGSLLGHADICNGSETVEGLREQVARWSVAAYWPVLKASDFPAAKEAA